MGNKKLTTSVVASLLLATNLYSNELSTELSSITIYSATKSEQSIKDVTSNVEVITEEEIEERHYTTITEALNSLSGLSFTSNGGLGKSTSIRLRGFDSQRLLVLVDGVRYNDFTSTSGAQPENIMMRNVKRIEVIKGAQSGIWGADASAGVINIITKDTKEGIHGSLNAEYGSFNTKKYGIDLSYKEKNYYVNGFYNALDTDGFTAYATRGDDIDNYEDDAYNNDTYGLKAGFNFDDSNKIDLSHTIYDSKNEYDNFNSDSLTNYSKSKTKISRVDFENKNSFAKTNVYYNRSDFDRKYYSSSPSHYKGNINELGTNSTIDYLDNTSFINLGLDYKKFKENDSISKNYTNKGLFLTNSNRFNNTVITQSLRYDNYDAFDNKTTGKLGIKHNFTDDLYVGSNYGTAYNIPTLNQLYGAFGANANLNPETTKSFDLYLGYRGLEVTYFYNKIRDMIQWNGSGYDNIDGESILKGLELNYQKEVISNTLLTLGYTRLSAKDNEGKDLARRANQTLKFAVDYYGFDKIHLGINGEYVGKRFDGANKTGQQTGKYTLFNFVANYEISSELSVYSKIDNLFDKYYQTVDGYATAPRSFYVGLKYSF